MNDTNESKRKNRFCCSYCNRWVNVGTIPRDADGEEVEEAMQGCLRCVLAIDAFLRLSAIDPRNMMSGTDERQIDKSCKAKKGKG